ncbi:CHASE2 domain-containing protein [Trinickia fusca]|uniref:histidine kinase n=1 Tax=Trinickia fusca TaxID=2419777 RepID=A0A494X1D2_9BURK|nr:CHASE2 domain-containing protein [Trinickia fusca]RKP44130.1 CHASE2 domain-containing protein [Trinickia fusca]
MDRDDSHTPLLARIRARFRFGRPVERRFIVEWLAIGCLGVVVVFFGSIGHATLAVDRHVYDRLLVLRSRPLVPDIAIVEIDDATVSALGRWPWRRKMQASMLETVARAQPAAIVYDVLFTEPADDDDVLADAIRAVPTYLPLLLSPREPGRYRVAMMPVAPLAGAAAGVGHINLEADPDGIVRSVALAEGDEQGTWPDLVVPVFRAIRDGSLPLADGRYARYRGADPALTGADDERILIPFSRQSNAYPRISFIKMLNGEISPDLLRGKIVLVGVTASGLYDHLATPVSGETGPFSDVQMHANVLDALLSGQAIRQIDPHWVFALSLAPLMCLLAGFFVLSPWRSLLLTGVLGAAVTAGSAVLLDDAGMWLSPVPALVALIVIYPLWSWRRLEMTMSRLRRELRRLRDEPSLLPETPVPAPEREFGGDVLERHIALMAQAAERVQDMKRFVWDSLNSVPEPILVTDQFGAILIANHAGHAHFARLGRAAPEGRTLVEALGDLAFMKTIDADSELDTHMRSQWPAILDPTLGERVNILKKGVEVRDLDERDYLLRYARCRNALGDETGWIAGLVDVTALHAAERHREDALRLLSHDMRSPQASILALVDLERGRTDSERTRGLLERVERYAQRTLELADDFVQLARAESQAYVLEPVNFTELLIDASDEVWPQARAKHIRIDTRFDGDEHWICVDRSLMTRVLTNILSNAVKYSPSDTQVTITAGATAPQLVQCTIRDEGYGIPEEAKTHLFERFRRFRAPGQPPTKGVGLGMAFVKTVVTRHGGQVSVDSAPGSGTTLTVSLPAFEGPLE